MHIHVYRGCVLPMGCVILQISAWAGHALESVSSSADFRAGIMHAAAEKLRKLSSLAMEASAELPGFQTREKG